jgi:response regulator RpfG family c-di-GMP phosphodiesterase
MPPEQVADAATCESPADVYALGATLFWCLTGQLPYEKAMSTKQTLHQIRTQEPRLLRDLNEDLPEDLEAVLARMMHRNPAERPSAREAGGMLAAFADATAHPAVQGVDLAEQAQSQLDLLRTANAFLEECLATRAAVAADAAAAVLTSLGRVAQFRGEPAGVPKRLQEYVRTIGRYIARKPDWSQYQDPAILDDVVRAIPVRNVGMVGVPDHVLGATADLSRENQAALERHPLIGCHILDVVVARHGRSLPFARATRDVIRSHHEKWDGSGFPDRLRHEAIPHAARLVAVAEAYDALRQPLGAEPGLTHEQAIEGLVNDSKGFFDPNAVDALVACHAAIASAFASIPD